MVPKYVQLLFSHFSIIFIVNNSSVVAHFVDRGCLWSYPNQTKDLKSGTHDLNAYHSIVIGISMKVNHGHHSVCRDKLVGDSTLPENFVF